MLLFSAGFLAQLALMLLALLFAQFAGRNVGDVERCLYICFTWLNIFLVVTNLIPGQVAGGLANDGLVLWRLFLHAYRNGPHPHPRLEAKSADVAPVFSPETRLLSMPTLIPSGFRDGIEILNDRTTPMELVVTTLMKHLELSRDEAIVKMLAIHNNGGLLVPLPTKAWAEQVATAISSDAKLAGHQLICRAVSSANE
ncbi:MAG TPA: ATP-dependent Clp protease adaptor ClpS [Nevskiaceae bacterium]|nr:ATP-dependent Clp protease adaptor ClpS [Nevskiaceae bacterium]